LVREAQVALQYTQLWVQRCEQLRHCASQIDAIKRQGDVR
jgi:hypothetical protein